jgi:hypothetical protein
MPVRETCLICGMELEFISGSNRGLGEYLHLFTSENYGKYKFVHTPHPVVQLNLYEDREIFPSYRAITK